MTEKNVIIYSPSLTKIGGMVTQVKLLSNLLKDIGVKHTVTTHSNGVLCLFKNNSFEKINDPLSEYLSKFDILITTDILLKGWKIVKTMLALNKVVILRIGSVIANFYISVLESKLSGFNLFNKPLRYGLNKILKYRISRISAVIFNSPAIQNQFGSLAIPRYIIPNATDHDPKIVISDFSLKYKIGYVGRIESRKGIDYILEISENSNLNHNIKFEIIGPKTDRHVFEKVKLLAKKNSNFSYLGRMNIIEWKKHAIENWDALIFTSNEKSAPMSEGMPNVLIEAASIGLPVLCFSNPQNEAVVVNNYSGSIAKVVSVAELLNIINEFYSGDMKSKFSENSIIRFREKFSIAIQKENYENLLSHY